MTDNPQRTIFISYRQDDNADFVARIRDWLIQKYGRDHVFMDFDSIPRFVKFKDFIRGKIEQSDVVIAIMGPRWLELLKAKVYSGDDDYVLIELESALNLNKLVAPVCIKGGSVPRKGELPASLRELVEFNAARLDSGAGFYDQIQGLMDDLESALESKQNTASKSAQEEEGSIYSKLGNEQKYGISGVLKQNKNDIDGAIADYNEALRLNPSFAYAYKTRATAYETKQEYLKAIGDYQKYLDLGGGQRFGDQVEVEAKVRELKKKLGQ